MADQPKKILCPYCGHTQTNSEKCESCGGRYDLLSRRATQISMGPWFLRDAKRPFLPGCSYEVLKLRIGSGKIKPLSIIRGPTTRQFWSVARNVPGVANLLGFCHKCGANVLPIDKKCGTCSASFSLQDMRVPDSDELGLLFPTRELATAAQKVLDAEIEKVLGKSPDAIAPRKPGEMAMGASQLATSSGDTGAGLPALSGDEPPGLPGADLLDDILGSSVPPISPKSNSPTPPPLNGPTGAPVVDKTPKPISPPKPAMKAPEMPAGPTDADLPDEPEDDVEKSHSRRKRGISPVTVVLIVIIILMAIAMLLIVLKFAPPTTSIAVSPTSLTEPPRAAAAPVTPTAPRASVEAAPKPAAPTAPSAASVASAAPRETSSPTPAASPLAPSAAPAVPAENPASPDAVYAAAPSPTTVVTTAPAATTAPATTTPATTAPVATRPAVVRPPPPLPMPQAIIEAQKLEAAGKAKEALTVLSRSMSITPLNQRPANFDEIYRRVEGKASLQAVPKYMEPPADMKK